MPINLLFLRKDDQDEKSFKQRKSFAMRKEEVAGIRIRFPNKIPIIVERYAKERHLPRLDKTKFLVPPELPLAKFIIILRNRMKLNAKQSFYLRVSDTTVTCMTKSMSDIYKEYKDKDGFLYMTYSSQEILG